MATTQPTSYDAVPYESHPFAQTHPDRLATVATLLGLAPPPVARCRVLELGCAAGGNLLPMAQTLPESTFVGIDLSARQIADGQRVIDALGLPNVTLKHLSILDVTRELGRFDYIICHGVYSWVPPAVQDKILEICDENLAPNGVAYVSYNTYPGWHMRGMIRDMMSYHARQFAEPHLRVQQARNLLDFLAKSVVQENSPYSLLLQSELALVRQSRDSYLFHEHLEECNDPIYFYQFAERAAAKGLQYLGESDLRVMVPGNYPPEVANVLKMLSADLIHLEQYMDFLRNRMFRQTLLCHRHLVPNYTVSPERLPAFHVASPARPMAAQPDIQSTEGEQFQGPDGATLTVRQPLAKAAMLCLAEAWPRAIPFDTLRTMARVRLNLAPETDAATRARETLILGQCLLTAYTSVSARLVELHVQAPPLVVEISERPDASPLARLQAAAGPHVTNLRHELVILEEFPRQVLRHLDGRHDRDALNEILVGLAAEGVLQLTRHGQPIREPDEVRAILRQGLEEQLPQLAANGLLIG
jgi:methyltransferase-like protein/2-polyprenyl-3-methyl-5-hydroxy-6-metoxy-1,4-benzoquinol methylase